MTKLPVGVSLLLFLLMCWCWAMGAGAIFTALFSGQGTFGLVIVFVVFGVILCAIGWWLYEKLKDWA